MEAMDNRYKNIHILIFLAVCLLLDIKVIAQHEIVYAMLSSTANLPCGSTSRPFPSDATEVYWHKGAGKEPNRILHHRFSDSQTNYFYGHSTPKYTCSSDRVLSIEDVKLSDAMTYTCTEHGSTQRFHFAVELQILVSPSRPELTMPSFHEGNSNQIQCTVSSVNPGVGNVVFTVSVEPDFSVQSSFSDLTEKSTKLTTGAVSVTYAVEVTLQRRHNGQQAVCQVDWRDGEEIVTSNKETVEVKYIPNLDGPLTAELHFDITVLFWPNITGIYSELVLIECQLAEEECKIIHKISGSTSADSPSYFIIQGPHDNAAYYLTLYQDDEEVFRGLFHILDKREQGKMNQEKSSANKGLLIGLIIVGVFTCLILVGNAVYFLHKKQKPLEIESVQRRSEAVYYNTTEQKSKPDTYEMTKPEEHAPPPEYADLKHIIYEEVGPAGVGRDLSDI